MLSLEEVPNDQNDLCDGGTSAICMTSTRLSIFVFPFPPSTKRSMHGKAQRLEKIRHIKGTHTLPFGALTFNHLDLIILTTSRIYKLHFLSSMPIIFQFSLKTAFRLAFIMVTTTLGTASDSSVRLVKRQGQVQVVTSCTEQNVAALTFNGGLSQYLREVSDALTAVGGKGTFFFNGQNHVNIYDSGPASNVQYAHQQGHQLASYTWSHPHLNTLTRDQVVAEFQQSELDERSIA